MNPSTTTSPPQVSVPGVGLVSNPGAYGYSSSGAPLNSHAPATPISADGLGKGTNALTVPQTPTSPPSASPTVPLPQGTTADATGNATTPPTTTDTSTSSQSVTDWIKQQLASLGGQLGTKSSVQSDLINSNNIAGKTTNATTSYNAYNAAKVDLQNRITQLQSTGGHGTSQGVQEQVDKMTREGNANLANLAVQAQTDQGLLDAAQKTVTEKINAQFQPVQDMIDFLTKFASVNNNDLTESQSKALDQKNQQLKDDKSLVQKASEDAHARIIGNKDYTSVASTLDKISKDFTDGKITAQEAQSQMTGATSKYLTIDEKYKIAQTNSLNTKTENIVNNGTGGQYKPDVYQAFTSISDADKNTPQSQFGGLTKTGLFNAAQLYLSENGKIPSIGLGSSGNQTSKRDSIINLGGAIADSLGMTLPQISAMYKANSTSATQIVNRVAKIDAVSNSLANQFPRLAELADKVGGLGITEQDLTATKAQIQKKFNNVDANNYIELLNTVRADYSAMQSAVAGSKGAQYFSGTAEKAIPIGATADVYRGLQQTILLSASNAQKGTQDEANALIGNIGSNSLGGNTNTGGTVQSNGKTWNVGQTYQDGSGAKWTVDTNGKWTKH